MQCDHLKSAISSLTETFLCFCVFHFCVSVFLCICIHVFLCFCISVFMCFSISVFPSAVGCVTILNLLSPPQPKPFWARILGLAKKPGKKQELQDWISGAIFLKLKRPDPSPGKQNLRGNPYSWKINLRGQEPSWKKRWRGRSGQSLASPSLVFQSTIGQTATKGTKRERQKTKAANSVEVNNTDTSLQASALPPKHFASFKPLPWMSCAYVQFWSVAQVILLLQK